LNVTDDAPVSVVPVMTTVVPTGPLAGVKLVIAGRTVKLVALVPVPLGVVTLIRPVVAVAGTVAVICVGESTVYTALAPLKVTAVAPVKLLPVTTTLVVPTGPLVGLKLVTVGTTPVGVGVRVSVGVLVADTVAVGVAVAIGVNVAVGEADPGVALAWLESALSPPAFGPPV